jgi:hypothetical protein
MIDRPEVDFDAVQHAYSISGEPVLGVSTIAKVGGVEDTWGIASAWGWRLGYEGARTIALGDRTILDAPVPEDYKKDPLRVAMNEAGLTPWATRDRAAERGSWVHDVLEELGQNGAVPDMEAFRERHGDEAANHARSVLRWFLIFRPSFVATEVQVASRTHGFAGRYDIRAKVEARRLVPLLEPPFCPVIRQDPQAVRIRELAARDAWALGLLDLKTSKGVYPTTHFPQLEGYEGAGVEMGFPATDFRGVINTNGDGSFDPATGFVVSWSTYDDFLAYLTALRAIRRINTLDPETIREEAQEKAVLAQLPATSRTIVERDVPELRGLDTRAVGRVAGRLRKRGLVEQAERGVWKVVEA